MVSCIKEFGFRIPIVAKSDGTVVDGHLRFKAARKMGLKEVPVVNADDLTEAQIKAFRLVANQSANWAEWNEELLKLEFKELDELDFDLELTGFDLEDVEKSLRDIKFVEEEQENAEKRHFETLEEKFLIPPFDILDARKERWLQRKRLWNLLIGDDGSTRGTHTYGTFNKSYGGCIGAEKMKRISVLDAVLAEIINLWFLPSGKNNTFDCFAGDIVFGYVSSYLGNNFTGIELRKEQADFNNSRVKGMPARYICDDGRNVLKHIGENSQDLLFSCPPYFNLEHYSDLKNDASNQKTYEDFLDILDHAFTDALKCLKNNRFAVIVVGDVRNKKTGGYYNFPNDIINIFRKNDLSLYNNIKILTPLSTAAIRAKGNMRNRKVVHVYQDVLVFYKGDSTKIKDIYGDVMVAELEDGSNESEDF